jgi:hypothetical protein
MLMKNLKRILAIATSMTMAIAMVAGVTPMTVKATDNVDEQQAMEYYGFTQLTSFTGLQENQIIYFTTEVLTAGTVLEEAPAGAGVLKFKNETYNGRQRVDVIESAADFDPCQSGYLWFTDEGEGVMQIHYACGGGAIDDLYQNGEGEVYYAYTCLGRPLGSGGDGYTPDPAPYIPPHEHTYEWVELVDMDGYFLGQEQYKCTGCGHVRESRTLNYTCPVIDETLDEVAKVESEIAANPTGANRTITKDVGGYYFINRPLAEAFTQNGTITLIYTFLYEHKLYELTIPAGFDLTAVLNEEGYAGFMWIAAHPGTTLEEIGEYYY